MKTLILIANGTEESEAIVTYDLLKRAQIEVLLVGLEKKITSSHNLQIETDTTIDLVDYRDFDCLVLPGGIPGTYNLEKHPIVNEMIDYFYKNHKIIAAICAAPSILIHKEIIINQNFTCYPGFDEPLKSTGNLKEVADNIITAKGLGAAFEFSHAIISKLISVEKADEILKQIGINL